MKWNNECDTCHNEPTCFDTPTDNCKQYKNYDVENIDRLIIRLGTLKEEIKQMSKHEDEIAEQAKSDGAREFAEWLQEYVIIDIESCITYVGEKEYTRLLSFIELLDMWQKEQNNEN